MLILVEHLHLRQEEDQLFVSYSDVFPCSSLKFSYLLLAVSSAVGIFEMTVS